MNQLVNKFHHARVLRRYEYMQSKNIWLVLTKRLDWIPIAHSVQIMNQHLNKIYI